MPPGSSGTARRGPEGAVLLGRYEQFFRIAAGGMAEVYAGRIRGEAGFEKLVAIKRMLPHLAEDERFVDMFLDEGRVAANVASPHVVQTLDLGRAEDGSLFLVLDLVVGASLWALMRAAARRNQPIPIAIALEILAQSAQGLDDAHEATTPTGVHLGIVHRDVSPQNLLVGVDGRARVTDFGIARALMRRTNTSTGELKGKVPYFSPEQARGQDLDRRSDVFALGIVAWEAITGQRLFGNDEALRTLQRVLEQPIPDPRTIRADLPARAAAVIQKALSRDVTARWQTAGELGAALREAARAVGPWVADLAGEPLRSMRERLDAALNAGARHERGADEVDDEAATQVSSAQGVASGVLPRAAQTPSVTMGPQAAPNPGPAEPALIATSQPPIPMSQPSISTVSIPEVSPDEVAAMRGSRGRARGALIALGVVALVGAVFWLGRMSGPQQDAAASAAPSATAPPAAAPSEAKPAEVAATVTAEPAPRPSAKNASAAPAKARPSSGDGKPAPQAAAPAPSAAPVTTAEPPKAPAQPAPSPAPAPKPAAAPTGPLLGDDAFNRDVSRMH
jgi:serine/threonine-protein kinase